MLDEEHDAIRAELNLANARAAATEAAVVSLLTELAPFLPQIPEAVGRLLMDHAAPQVRASDASNADLEACEMERLAERLQAAFQIKVG